MSNENEQTSKLDWQDAKEFRHKGAGLIVQVRKAVNPNGRTIYSAQIGHVHHRTQRLTPYIPMFFQIDKTHKDFPKNPPSPRVPIANILTSLISAAETWVQAEVTKEHSESIKMKAVEQASTTDT